MREPNGQRNTAGKKSRIPNEGKGLILLGFSLILLLSMLSFHTENTGRNWLGLAGWGLGWVFNYPLWTVQLSDDRFSGMDRLADTPQPRHPLADRQVHLLRHPPDLLLSFPQPLCRSLACRSHPSSRIKSILETHFFDLPYPHRATRYNLGGVPLYYLYTDLPTMNLQRMLSDVGIGLTFAITGLVSFLSSPKQLVPLLGTIKRKAKALKATLVKAFFRK